MCALRVEGLENVFPHSEQVLDLFPWLMDRFNHLSKDDMSNSSAVRNIKKIFLIM